MLFLGTAHIWKKIWEEENQDLLWFPQEFKADYFNRVKDTLGIRYMLYRAWHYSYVLFSPFVNAALLVM